MHLATSSKDAEAAIQLPRTPVMLLIYVLLRHYSSTALKPASVNHILPINMVRSFPNLKALAHAIALGFQQAAFLLKSCGQIMQQYIS